MDLTFAWEPFISYGQKRKVKKNAILYRQGEIGSGFYYLDQGEVTIKLLSDRGDERIIDYISPGELLGEQGIKGEAYFTTASLTKPSTLFYFSNEDFEKICKTHPNAADIIMNSIIKKVRLLAETVSIQNSSMEHQMAHFLYKLYIKHGKLDITIDQTSLAHYIGTSRVTVYKILQQWKARNIITIENRKIHLLDIVKLKAILN
jgi:CRP/FNR family cyclic AMP-dependent transcriptional regulator